MNEDPLALDRETMRRLGYRTVDLLVERLTDPSAPPIRRASAEEMRRRVPSTDPEHPQDLDQILEHLDRDVLPFASRDHPGFFAFIPFAGTWPGALGDLIASACNLYAGSWMAPLRARQGPLPRERRLAPARTREADRLVHERLAQPEGAAGDGGSLRG